MGKLGGIVLVSALALTGCSAAAAAGHVPDTADPASFKGSGYSADEFFIVGVKLKWQGAVPHNSDLVAAGEAYCSTGALPAGENGRTIATYAKATYCP